MRDLQGGTKNEARLPSAPCVPKEWDDRQKQAEHKDRGAVVSPARQDPQCLNAWVPARSAPDARIRWKRNQKIRFVQGRVLSEGKILAREHCERLSGQNSETRKASDAGLGRPKSHVEKVTGWSSQGRNRGDGEGTRQVASEHPTGPDADMSAEKAELYWVDGRG